VLLDRIAGLRLRYFGVQGQSGPADRLPRWDTVWRRTDRLPALVEVTVEFPATDTRRWPALILPLGAGS
jgi:general secretion pathway protein J